jgi:heme exporter protein C
MTSMLVLLFLYAGFIAFANATQDRASISMGAAIYAVVGAINLPIINRSVVWWNSLHQPASITTGGSAIAPSLLWPLGLTVLGFSLLFGAIVLMRMRAILADAKVEARQRRLAAG